MIDRSHLDAIELRLSHERGRLRKAVKPHEIEQRAIWVAQIEREITNEKSFLGIVDDADEISDDDLLAALGA